MTISKLTLLSCALALGTIGFSARADDNPAQAAARAALAKQLFETSGHPSTNAPAAAPVMAPATPAPAVAAQPPAAQPAPAAMTNTDEQAAAQRAALAAALAGSTNTMTQGNAVTNAAAAPAKHAKAKKEKKKQEAAAAAPKPAPKPASQPVVAPPPAPATNDYLGKDLGMKQIATPPLPISASKEARLQALLEKYKADQITPDEYHQQRAAILAEP